MHGNYRHHYLLSTTASQSPASTSTSLSSSLNKSRQQQQAVASNFNGLPAVSNDKNYHSQISPGNYQQPAFKQHQQQQQQQLQQQQYQQSSPPHECFADQLINSQRFNNHHLIEQHQQQQLYQMRAATGGDYCIESDMPIDAGSQRARQQIVYANNNNQILQSKQREFFHQQHEQDTDQDNEIIARNSGHHTNQDYYASQLRISKLQHRFQPTSSSYQFSPASMQQHGRGSSGPKGRSLPERPRANSPQVSSVSSSPQSASFATTSSGTESSASNQQWKNLTATKEDKTLHVNFNRANQAVGPDEEEGDSRKKKYLTAKYGQQQMNLIKKRLKIEMWLYEQLQELAKGSKSEAELDDIDVDLDQLLDMDDDDTRRRWLKKTLEPFEDLPIEKINKFICDVLEQSKLL